MAKIECLKYKVLNKGSLEGFANIFVPSWGIEINGIAIFRKNGKRWVNFPSKEYESDGVKKYYPYIRFKDDKHKDLFDFEVIEAIQAFGQDNAQQTF